MKFNNKLMINSQPETGINYKQSFGRLFSFLISRGRATPGPPDGAWGVFQIPQPPQRLAPPESNP